MHDDDDDDNDECRWPVSQQKHAGDVNTVDHVITTFSVDSILDGRTYTASISVLDRRHRHYDVNISCCSRCFD